MEKTKPDHNTERLAIAGLVIAIITLTISFIPGKGMFALIPGTIAILFSAIALKQANKTNTPKNLIMAALIVAVIGTSIAFVWGMIFVTTDKHGISNKERIEERTKKK